MKVKILRQFADPAELKELKEWIGMLHKTGVLRANTDGAGRFFRPLGQIPEHSPVIARLKRDLQARFNITGKCLDLTIPAEVQKTKATPSFVGMQTEGGFVHPHIDGNVGEGLQFRCTLLVNKPESGGMLLIEREPHPMEEGDIYCFVSNNTMHGSTPVKGNKPRMVCSLGFIVDKAFSLDVVEG